jgi:hypothetical protein
MRPYLEKQSITKIGMVEWLKPQHRKKKKKVSIKPALKELKRFCKAACCRKRTEPGRVKRVPSEISRLWSSPLGNP